MPVTDEKILKLFGKHYGVPFYHHESVLRFARQLLKKADKQRGKNCAETL